MREPDWYDDDLAIYLLKFLERSSDANAFETIKRIAKSARSERVRKEAQQCLPLLQERMVQQDVRRTLLRSAQAEDTPDRTLLRAARSSQSTEATQLLRAGASEE